MFIEEFELSFEGCLAIWCTIEFFFDIDFKYITIGCDLINIRRDDFSVFKTLFFECLLDWDDLASKIDGYIAVFLPLISCIQTDSNSYICKIWYAFFSKLAII